MEISDVTRTIQGIELDEEQLREWHRYFQAACSDEALADAVWALAHDVRDGRWVPLGRPMARARVRRVDPP